MSHSLRFDLLVVLALGLGVLLLRRVVRWGRRVRSVPAGAWVELRLEGSVAEWVAPEPRWRKWLVPGPRTASVFSLRKTLLRVAADPRVGGVLVRLQPLACGWATAQSLRELLLELRRSGKTVVAWMPSGGTSLELFVATGAEKIYAAPQASVAPLGVARGMNFFKGLLARGGIEAEVLARREYKSAAESFSRDSLSDANREQLGALLDAVHGALLDALAERPGIDREKAQQLVDGAPYRAREAVTLGLLDGVAYEDELPALLGTPAPRLVSLAKWLAVTPPPRQRRGARVAVVEVRGTILDDGAGVSGNVATASRVTAALRIAASSPMVGAVVLAVDSPGGSALASDLIAREVGRLDAKKPVVAYFSDVSASGGYYISAGARRIIARPLTVTGSIGVIALRFVVEKALDSLGVTHEVVRRGARADLNSPYRHWTEEERAAMDREIDGFYQDFVALVAKGRKREVGEVEPLARGRVWAGKDALEKGLVDELGGLDAAVGRAAELAGLSAELDPVLVRPPRGEVPPPPEPPAPVKALLGRLGLPLAWLDLLLGAPPHERVFLLDERLLNQ